LKFSHHRALRNVSTPAWMGSHAMRDQSRADVAHQHKTKASTWLGIIFVALSLTLGIGQLANAQSIVPSDCNRTADLRSSKAQVRAALAPVEEAQTARLRNLEGANHTDRALTEAIARYRRDRREALTSLAKLGDPEAMQQLAGDLRDSPQPEDVRTWLAYTRCAASMHHPAALDELVRWTWHQRGDGSLAAVQANRAAAMDLAAEAAEVGNYYSLFRIAGYISGSVHQYPGNLALGAKVLNLCAQTDDALCEQGLAGLVAYDYRQSPVLTQVWLTRLAIQQPQRFTERRDAALARLSGQDRVQLETLLLAWRAKSWPELRNDWAVLKAEILEFGKTSDGPLTACTTPTPWCRTGD
jgi:hypothetical protein